MKHTKEEKVAYLFDEIGGVSDILLTEAMAYRPRKRQRMPKYLAVAASLAVCCILLAQMLLPTFKENSNQSGGAPNAEAPISLDALFGEYATAEDYTLLSSREELEFFDHKAYLVWQEEGSDTLCVSRPLTRAELLRLTEAAGQGSAVDPEEASPRYRVWILCGDGTVITPYLQSSAGTVGYGDLFDYDPELIPSQSFTSLVSDLFT